LVAGWYWPGVTLIYAGFLLLCIDASIAPELKNSPKWKIGIVTVLLAFGSAFSWAIVFVKAPLEISAIVTDAQYPPDSKIAGIVWRPEFTELQVWITNPSDRNYDDLTLVVRPTSAIAAIAQLTDVPNVSFEDKNGFTARLMDINPTAGTKNVVPLVLLATDTGYKMRCQHLSAGTEIKLEIALADIKWNPPAQRSSLPIEEQVRDKNYILRFKFDDFSTYWEGHPDGDVYAPRPTSTEWIKVEGEYNAAQRTRSISQKIEVAGNLTIKRQ
jgi:hypothetical protein